jgi:hypothetical protein
MWSINDEDGAEVAKSFYDYLLKQDGPPAISAALALHCSIHTPFMYLGVTGGAKRSEL